MAGMEFDYLFCGGALSEHNSTLLRALREEDQIQYFCEWPENRGQHWGLREALRVARAMAPRYTWLLRVDDDITFETRRWLQIMVNRLEWLREHAGDPRRRMVASPRVAGLNNPIEPIGHLQQPGQPFPAEAMEILGGACRIHPLEIFEARSVDLVGPEIELPPLYKFEPDVYAPRGRQDPEMIDQRVRAYGGYLIRFPDLIVRHDTRRLEGLEDAETKYLRQMNRFWPWLGEAGE